MIRRLSAMAISSARLGISRRSAHDISQDLVKARDDIWLHADLIFISHVHGNRHASVAKILWIMPPFIIIECWDRRLSLHGRRAYRTVRSRYYVTFWAELSRFLARHLLKRLFPHYLGFTAIRHILFHSKPPCKRCACGRFSFDSCSIGWMPLHAHYASTFYIDYIARTCVIFTFMHLPLLKWFSMHSGISALFHFDYLIFYRGNHLPTLSLSRLPLFSFRFYSESILSWVNLCDIKAFSLGIPTSATVLLAIFILYRLLWHMPPADLRQKCLSLLYTNVTQWKAFWWFILFCYHAAFLFRADYDIAAMYASTIFRRQRRIWFSDASKSIFNYWYAFFDILCYFPSDNSEMSPFICHVTKLPLDFMSRTRLSFRPEATLIGALWDGRIKNLTLRRSRKRVAAW